MPDAPASCLCSCPHADHQINDAGNAHECDLCGCPEYAADLTIPLPMETP